MIRVWDIVLDHDNLSRAIEQTIERIEKSHLRGEECALFAQLDKRGGQKGVTPSKDGTGVARIPRVFPMKNEVVCAGRDQPAAGALTQHFHPASEDPRQFTLLKFYELNKGAISILLDGQDDNVDLPFTPGPKEHEIIHYESDPRRSILLMGRRFVILCRIDISSIFVLNKCLPNLLSTSAALAKRRALSSGEI